MNVVTDTIQSLRSMRKRQLAHQVINLGLIVTSALMIWKSLMVITHSESPVVVVLRQPRLLGSSCPSPRPPRHP
ncbi:hypothetical protein T484DRAFT_1808139 [Baffinella frigidus]|nr:hypothetical protein T484DRAFT_1808139 [Cryptophyta sp. CCMP2293]